MIYKRKRVFVTSQNYTLTMNATSTIQWTT